MQAIQSIEKRNDIKEGGREGIGEFEITLRDLEPESVEREKKKKREKRRMLYKNAKWNERGFYSRDKNGGTRIICAFCIK